MINVFDILTQQVIYLNPSSVIYATINNERGYGPTKTAYDVYLPGDAMIRVNIDDFMRIKRFI